MNRRAGPSPSLSPSPSPAAAANCAGGAGAAAAGPSDHIRALRRAAALTRCSGQTRAPLGRAPGPTRPPCQEGAILGGPAARPAAPPPPGCGARADCRGRMAPNKSPHRRGPHSSLRLPPLAPRPACRPCPSHPSRPCPGPPSLSTDAGARAESGQRMAAVHGPLPSRRPYTSRPLGAGLARAVPARAVRRHPGAASPPARTPQLRPTMPWPVTRAPPRTGLTERPGGT